MTTSDVIILCGGAKNIGKIEAYKLFCCISQFIGKKKTKEMLNMESPHQWRTEGGGLGCSKPPRNSKDNGEVLDRVSKKNRRLDFLL